MGRADRVKQLEAENAVLLAKIEALEAELEKLRREQGRNSSNSGKPPSSDTITERAKINEQRLSRAERRRTAREKAKQLFNKAVKRRPGKQHGAAGSALRQVGKPDFTEVHVPGNCWRCAQDLAGADVVGIEKRQVFDLPVRGLEVTEHQAQHRRCGCGAVTNAPFPADAKVAANYGPMVRAVAVYLMVG